MVYLVSELLVGSTLAVYGFAQARVHDARTPFMDRLFVALAVVTGSALVIGVAQTFFPVATGFEVTVLERQPGMVEMRMVGDKVRACRLLGVAGAAFDADGQQYKASIEWRNDPAPGATRATGRQDFGLWVYRWEAGSEPIVSVMSQALHDCGKVWPNVTTKQGPFPVPEVSQ